MAQAKKSPQRGAQKGSRRRTVTVDGIRVTVDLSRATSWRALNYIRKIQSEETSQSDRMFATIDYYEYVFGKDETARVVERLGGEDVDSTVVIEFLTRVLDEVDETKN